MGTDPSNRSRALHAEAIDGADQRGIRGGIFFF